MPVQTVIATVTYTNDEKGFGFAEATDLERGERIYFRLNASRKVTGTADEPELTNEQETTYVTHRGRYPSKVVMHVVRSDKGYRAIRWGTVPKRNWIVDLINEGGLDKYVGGEINVHENRRLIAGTLTSVELTTEALTVTYLVGSIYQDNRLKVTRTFQLEGFNPKRTLPYGRFGIQSWDDVWITFYPPREP